MRMRKKTLSLLIVAIFVLSLLASMPTASACYKKGKVYRKASVSFKGYRVVSSGIKYYYKVRSGTGSQRIRDWKLKSSAFQNYDVIWASEPYTQKGSYLKFPKSYKSGQTRYVKFIIGKEYTPPKLGRVKYYIKLGQNWKIGWTRGPVMPRF